MQRDAQQERHPDALLQWVGPRELVTGLEGEPQSCLEGVTGLGKFRAWFCEDGRLVRAEFSEPNKAFRFCAASLAGLRSDSPSHARSSR